MNIYNVVTGTFSNSLHAPATPISCSNDRDDHFQLLYGYREIDQARMAGVVRHMSGEEMNGVAETRELAIEVRGAYKGYGSLRVLKGLDMSVPQGRM